MKIAWRGWRTWPMPCWLQVTMRLTRSVSDWQRSSSCGQSSTRLPGPGKRSETTRCCFILCGFGCLGALLLDCWLWECWNVVMQCSGLWFCGFLIDTVCVCVFVHAILWVSVCVSLSFVWFSLLMFFVLFTYHWFACGYQHIAYFSLIKL